MKGIRLRLCSAFVLAVLLLVSKAVTVQSAEIVHDAEYYILEAQNGEKWAKEDKALDKKLAELRKKNGGKPPNILYLDRRYRFRRPG